MAFIRSKTFQIIWAGWTLILGISLLFIHTLQNINSFAEYFKAFLILDMPASWCPTFLVLFGASTLLANLLGGSGVKKILIGLSRVAGLVLLPVGLYATWEFTFHSAGDPLPIYIYAQIIHVSEILTGLLTVFLLTKKSVA
jgi:hypothetical protein